MGKGKIIDLNSPESFYSRNRPQMQLGLYKLACQKHKIAVAVLVECIEDYRLSNQQNVHEPWGKNFTLDHISGNFNIFLESIFQKTGIKIVVKGTRKRRRNYHDWWEQNNLDGGFAYSGVTDDF